MTAVGVFQTNMNDVGEPLDLYTATGYIALSGGGQTNATPLVGQISVVATVAADHDSGRLRKLTKGRWQVVINAGAHILDVYPFVGSTISPAAVNVPFSMPAGTIAQFVATSDTNSYALFSSALSGASLPIVKDGTTALASGVIPAANLTGASFVTLSSSGATGLTTPTAAAMLAAIPNGFVGQTWRLRIINTNGGTLTITADASVTATGTLTLSTNTWREWDMTIVTATTASMVQVGTGTNS